jgi:hypothetical protein
MHSTQQLLLGSSPQTYLAAAAAKILDLVVQSQQVNLLGSVAGRPAGSFAACPPAFSF